jgi:signal transduction histidine kinase
VSVSSHAVVAPTGGRSMTTAARREAASTTSAPGLLGGLADALRRAPLMVKVGGASLPLLATVLLLSWWNLRLEALPRYAFALVLVVALATVVVHLALVAFAWHPIERVSEAVDTFASGDDTVRVRGSDWSDQDVVRLEHNVDRLFDVVRRDRTRYRALAAQVLQRMEDEQGEIARELFDSTAQSMAALLLELRALTSVTADVRLLERLDGVRQIAAGVLDDVKALSHEANPRWQANEGLQGALQHLVREHNAHTEARLTFEAPNAAVLADPAASALVYRTARAALRFAAQERCPGLELSVRLRADRLVLDVIDARERAAPIAGAMEPESIDVLRARAELLGGSLDVQREGDRRRLRLEVPIAIAPVGDLPLQESP